MRRFFWNLVNDFAAAGLIMIGGLTVMHFALGL
jgi:hypothetical protein